MITRFRPLARTGDDRIRLSEPELAGNEWKYVKECLDAGYVADGGMAARGGMDSAGGESWVSRFEEAVAERIGMRHAVATSSGTAALHLSLLAAGVRADDEVLVSTLTFIAPVNAIRYVGARPVFVDAEPTYWQMDVSLVERFLESQCELRGDATYNRETGRRVRAIVPVHLLGHPVDVDRLRSLARVYRLVMIEDAAESLGGEYKGRPIGMTNSISILSFNGNKIITTGGGGMVLTDNARWAEKCRYLASQANDNPVEFVHGDIGYNYRLSNLQAALGCAQIELLEHHVARKRRIAARYNRILSRIPGIHVMPQAPWARTTYWLYTILVDEAKYGMDARELGRQLLEHGIETRPLWEPMHLSKPHAGHQTLGGAVAERLCRQSLCLPCSVGFDLEHVERIAHHIRDWSRVPQALGL